MPMLHFALVKNLMIFEQQYFMNNLEVLYLLIIRISLA